MTPTDRSVHHAPWRTSASPDLGRAWGQCAINPIRATRRRGALFQTCSAPTAATYVITSPRANSSARAIAITITFLHVGIYARCGDGG